MFEVEGACIYLVGSFIGFIKKRLGLGPR